MEKEQSIESTKKVLRKVLQKTIFIISRHRIKSFGIDDSLLKY